MRKVIDLRRDTITLPTEEMKRFAFQVPLGDSVYGEDPMQNELEALAASLLGKEASIFLPSGTMGNLVALLVHTNRGDEVILEENAHIRTSETGGIGAIAGLMVRTLRGEDGAPDPDDIRRAIRPKDIHYPCTRLICLENTHYRYGGIVPPLSKLQAIKRLAEEEGLRVHLDGARLFNASVYLGIPAKDIAACADTVMISLSKGLGAPVGSILAGPKDLIEKAKWYRKMLGGGMRQTGWLCACGIVALSPQNIARLAEDHANARLLAEKLAEIEGFEVDLSRVQTNFVLLRIQRKNLTAYRFAMLLKERGVLVTPVSETLVRLVTSKEVAREDILNAVAIIQEVLEQ